MAGGLIFFISVGRMITDLMGLHIENGTVFDYTLGGLGILFGLIISLVSQKFNRADGTT